MKTKKDAYEFKKHILKKAKIKDGDAKSNIKLGNMGSWGELFGDCTWYIPELDMWINGTCGKFCTGCFDKDNPRCSECYVAKSYVRKTKRNDDNTVGNIITNSCTVKLGHAYRTVAMTMYRKDLLTSLDYQLMRKRKKFEVVRINESGELTCFEDFELWCELAKRHPETTFYLYTKNYDAIRKAIKLNIIPNNLFVNISIWHEFGISEYLEMKKHPQIRAFVMVDEDWTEEKYKSKGIDIKSMCGAYSPNGKMNHKVTCDKCKKCFGNNSNVTGCYKH